MLVVYIYDRLDFFLLLFVVVMFSYVSVIQVIIYFYLFIKIHERTQVQQNNSAKLYNSAAHRQLQPAGQNLPLMQRDIHIQKYTKIYKI